MFVKYLAYFSITLFVSLSAVPGHITANYVNEAPEDDINLAIHIQKSEIEKIWSHLQDRYQGNSRFLSDIDPSLSSSLFLRIEHENYFDSPTLELLNTGNEVKHHIWHEDQKGEFVKKEESVIISINAKPGVEIDLANVEQLGLVRGETIAFPANHYSVPAYPEEKHPLLGIVKRNLRHHFLETINKVVSGKQYSLKHIVSLTHNIGGFNILHKDSVVGKIYLDSVKVERGALENSYAVLTIEFDNPRLENARQPEDNIGQKIVDDLHAEFPQFRILRESHYDYAFHSVEENIPFLRILIKFPFIEKLGEIVLFSSLGFILLAVLFPSRILGKKIKAG